MATFQLHRQLIEMPRQKKGGVRVSCKDGGVIPDTGFPRDGDMANKEERAKTTWTQCKNKHLGYDRPDLRSQEAHLAILARKLS